MPIIYNDGQTDWIKKRPHKFWGIPWCKLFVLDKNNVAISSV